MAKQRNALKAGIFMILSLALIIGVAVAIKGTRGLFEPTRIRSATFGLADDIGGLQVGNDIRIGGYKVGTVKQIKVAGASEGYEVPRIVVTFSMPRGYVLHKNARVRIQTSFTGASVLNFESLGTGDVLSDEATLAGSPSSMNEVVTSAQGLMADLRSKTLPAVNSTVTKFGQTADSVTQTSDAARAMVKPISEQLPEILTKVNGVVTKLDTTVQSANEALVDVRAAAGNLKEITAAGQSVIVGNKSKLDGMIASLKITSDNLRNASAEIRRSPWRLLYKPDEAEAGNLNLFDAARQFAQGANDLNDAAQALRDTMHDKQADPEQIRKLMERLEASFANFNKVEKGLWTAVKE